MLVGDFIFLLSTLGDWTVVVAYLMLRFTGLLIADYGYDYSSISFTK
jgi:hypothetical protein